jgi:hypothetical protein
VHEDPKRVKRYNELLSMMTHGGTGEARGFDEYWEAVSHVIDEKLFDCGGARSVEEWIKSVVKEPYRTVMRNIRVARHATPEEEARYTVTKLDAALSFVEARMGGPANGHLPIRWESLRIPVQKQRTVVRLSLGDATIAQINAATRAVLAREKHGTKPQSPSEMLLKQLLAAEKQFANVTIHVSDGSVRFGAVPLASIRAFASAIRKFRVPAVATKKTKTSARKKSRLRS